MARIAAIKAKQQALEHLRAIKLEIETKNRKLIENLEEKKIEARDLQEKAFPIGERLKNIQNIACAWESSGKL